jgi:F420-non-reducing hydrogenase small subunit
MASRTTVATAWLQGCSGCHISFLDLNEALLDVLARVDIRYSPIVDIKEIPEVDVALVEGAVGNEENEHVLRELRAKAKLLVAFGTCACYGGVTSLRNLTPLGEVLDRAYVSTESTVDGQVPRGADIPAIQPWVRAVRQVVEVDATIPGCPPLPSIILKTVLALLDGKPVPQRTRNLCAECDRHKERMLVASRDFIADSVYSPHELETIDPKLCFLEQGVLCMGPATCEGCEARCMKGNMPCRGCMGPPPGSLEQGAKAINALSAILPAGALMFRDDVVGVGYRYSMPISVIPHIVSERRKA